MTPTPRRAALPRAAILVVCLAAAAVIAIGSGMAAGAALGASAEPSADPGETNIEAWLDVAIPADVAVDAPYGFGVTLWDTTQDRFAEFNEAFVRLHPAKGKAKPTVGQARSDWPGHLMAEVNVPEGGAGELEMGLSGQACTVRGSVQTCADQEFPFRMAGSGPPPDAPLSALVVATTAEPHGPLLAGMAIDVSVSVEPRGTWDIEALHLPDQLIAFANKRSGPDLATTVLTDTGQHGASPAVYAGQITIEEPGDVTLFVALPGNGTADQILQGATTRLSIGGDAGPASPTPAAPGPTAAPADTGGPPWPLIGLGALMVVAGLLVRRVFADL